MSNESLKISQLPATSTVPENGNIPISDLGEWNLTFKATVGQLRSTLNFDNAFESVEEGQAATKENQIFYVYTDDSKGTVAGWVNSGIGVSALVGGDGNQITNVTGKFLKNTVGKVELGSTTEGEGAYLSGWQRNFVLGTIDNIAQSLNSGSIELYEYTDLCVPVTINGVVVLDWAAALTKALLDAATYRKTLHVPGGQYYLSSLQRFTNIDTSGTNTAMSVYSLVGDGFDNTIFWTDSTASNFLNFYTCRVFLKDWTFQRRNVTVLNPSYEALSLLSFGDVTLADGAVRASLVSNVRIAGSGTGLQIQQAWDCVFDRLIIQDYGVSGVYINRHNSDNSNNLLFIRLHIETCRYSGTSLARAFAMLNGSGGTNRNHGITLVEPHIEPVNWRCMHLYLSYPLHFEVINGMLNRNNSTAYSDSKAGIDPITDATAQPIIYINDAVNTHFRGGQAIHIGSLSDSVSPIMVFSGVMKGFGFNGYIDTGKATRTTLAAGIDVTNAVNGMREIDFNGCTVNSFTSMSSVGSRLRITPLDNLQKSMDLVGEQYTPEGTSQSAMVMKLYQSNTQDQSTAMTELMQIYSEGFLRIKGYLGTRVTIAPGAIYGFVVGSGVTNRRGKYGIYGLMNDAQLFCEFFNVPGLSPAPIAIGTSVSLTQNIPDVSVTNKLCIYQTTSNNQYITLDNRTATAINVSVLFWAS